MTKETNYSITESDRLLRREVKNLLISRIKKTTDITPIESRVYDLMGEHFYTDNLVFYPFAITKFLSIMATDQELNSSIKSKMGGSNYDHLIELLKNLQDFITASNDSDFQLKMDIADMDWHDYSEDDLLDLKEKWSK